MKASHLLLKRVVPSLVLLSAVALGLPGQAHADKLDCSPEALAQDLKLARQAPNLTTYASIVTGTQNIYSCRVNSQFLESPQAVFLSRTGQRIVLLAKNFTPTNVHLCTDINHAVTGAIGDISNLQSVDSSAALATYKADLQSVADTNCFSLIGKIFSDDSFSDKMTRDFCAYKKLVETQHPGSTTGFSRLVAPCAR